MSKNLTLNCTCGNSSYCTEKELRASLSNVHTCRELVTEKDGTRRTCGEQYSYFKLLKIMQITKYWDAKDEATEARAENVEI